MSLACRQCYVAPKSTRSTQKRQQLAVCPSFNHSPAVLVVQNHVGFYAEVQTYFPPHLSPFVFLFVRATLVALVGLIKSISIQKQYLFSTQLLSLTQVQNGKSEQISVRDGGSGEVDLRCGWRPGTDPGLSRRHFREPSPHDPIHTVDGFQRILRMVALCLYIHPSLTVPLLCIYLIL